jgi:dTMP kinase
VTSSAASGFFLVFEGGEGAGKSTQIAAVVGWLADRGLPVQATREPGATPLGARLRALLLDPDTEVAPRTEALLYAADRAEHVATVIRPALAAGAIVVSDRYIDSSLAYQGAGRELAVADVAQLSRWATGDLEPDLTVLLDLPVEQGLARARGRGAADRLEREDLSFHQRVRAHFLALAGQDPSRYVVLDATLPAVDITTQIMGVLAGRLPELAQTSLNPTSLNPTGLNPTSLDPREQPV